MLDPYHILQHQGYSILHSSIHNKNYSFFFFNGIAILRNESNLSVLKLKERRSLCDCEKWTTSAVGNISHALLIALVV